MSDAGWIGVDLYGTLAKYESGQWPEIGEPIAPMVERVKKWLAEGKDVRIVTARVGGIVSLEEADAQIVRIMAWCERVLGESLSVQSEKDYDMIELWDDRAVQVVKNTGENLVEKLRDALVEACELYDAPQRRTRRIAELLAFAESVKSCLSD